MSSLDNPRIAGIEWGRLEGGRPRNAGSNARLGEHGITVRVPVMRLTLEDGSSGFGACRAEREQIERLLGMRLSDITDERRGVAEAWIACEYPIWDLLGKIAGKPVYALAAELSGKNVQEPYRAPCYDTSLYFDDLHLQSDREAAALIADEARQGYERGHRAFKIKVGRGAYHLPLEQGTARDIAVVQAVSAAVGKNIPLMIDANNGYNLNLAKHVLAETANCPIFWIEEPFHEDRMLYTYLKDWLKAQESPVLIADGEGQASPTLLNWAHEGLVDVVQYDIFSYGFTHWLALGQQLDDWGVRSAPHHYGGHYGNYAACHLASAIRGFAYVEWDEATTPGLDASGYSIQDGWVHVPDAPGFGLDLDEATFRHAVETDGFRLVAS